MWTANYLLLANSTLLCCRHPSDTIKAFFLVLTAEVFADSGNEAWMYDPPYTWIPFIHFFTLLHFHRKHIWKPQLNSHSLVLPSSTVISSPSKSFEELLRRGRDGKGFYSPLRLPVPLCWKKLQQSSWSLYGYDSQGDRGELLED